MLINELIKKLYNYKKKYGNLKVTISNNCDAMSSDFQEDIKYVVFEDYEDKKAIRIFYESE